MKITIRPLNTIIAIIAMAFFSVATFAQSFKDIFDTKNKIVWLGLDFTGAKFQGDREKFGTDADVHKLILAWNNLMINEPEKYDMGKALHRPLLKNVVPIAISHNGALNLEGIVEDDSKSLVHLDKEAISRIVSSYDFGEEKGIGVMLVVESFSKIDLKGLAWITFVDLDAKKVLYTERFIGKPGGFGLRNYWAGSIYNILKDVKSNYNTWEKKYAK